MFKRILILLIAVGLIGCNPKKDSEDVQIAFLADVHFQDIYGEFSDTDYKGVFNGVSGKHTLARTMESQLNSTRLFNENYFALIAALDDIVERDVTYVVLPGDFSDDGQAINIRGLKKILLEYEEEYDIHFVLTTGNHDPVRPFYQDAGKKDFLGRGGANQPIYSTATAFKSTDEKCLEPIITKDIAKLGYEQIQEELKGFGFNPTPSDVYWETPFSTYKYANYSFDKAKEFEEIVSRSYQIAPFETMIPDMSYLVEPKDDLWFLAIDANVYLPKESDESTPEFGGASIGYNNVITHKKHLFEWIKTVTERAEIMGKTLIVFSHYPVLDFNDGASENIKDLLGDKKMQLHRVPNQEVAKFFSEAGVKIHFGGHMHINDTGIQEDLVNIQIPSLAAYIAAYKLLTISDNEWEIETIAIDDVPRFKELFPLYQMEHELLEQSNAQNIWDKNILEASTYKEFTDFHLKELVRLRFLKKDWPEEFKAFFLNTSGLELMQISNPEFVDESGEFGSWTGLDFIVDLYRLRSADELAFEDIGLERMQNYKDFIASYSGFYSNLKQPTKLQSDLFQYCEVFRKFSQGEAANHFKINTDSMELKNLN